MTGSTTAAPPLGADYRRLLAANVASNLGDGIALVALPWYASTLTDDPVAIAAVTVAGRLPWLLLALLAGVAGDRVDRRRLMVTASGAKAAVLTALAALVALDVGSVPVVLAVALAIGTCEVFVDNTNQTMLPRIVAPARLERANGTMWAAEEVANRFAGPALGGLLIAVSLAAPFAAQALLTACAVALLVRLRGDFRPRGGPTAHPPVRTMLADGLRWLWRHRLLRTLAVVLGLLNAAGAAEGAVLVLFAQDVLGLGSGAFGAVLTAVAVGGVLGAQVGPWLAARISPGATIGGVIAAQAALYAATALVPVVPVFAVAAALIGFTSVWWNVVTVSLCQRIIPDPLLSRVNSAYRTLGWGMIPLGAAGGGALVALTEPSLGREWALRTPYLAAAAVCAALLVVARRSLTTALIRAAERAAQP